MPEGSNELSNPYDMVFGPGGNLYVSSNNNDRVVRYNGATGAFMGVFVAPGSGGLDYPQFLIFQRQRVP